MGKIALLDELTANQIAAGEVIERPVSVVKELTENALDAGAGNITVEIASGGLSLIKVIDDGYGMSAEDLNLSVKRHATSKLRNISDLETIGTLGFRGEAIASIVSVAKVELISRELSAQNGHRLLVEGNETKTFEPCGAPIGTTIVVQDLFYNTPARRKFLRTAGYEAGLIHELLIQLSLGYPQVNFRLINEGKEILNTYGVNKTSDLITLFYGKEANNALIAVEGKTNQASFKGWLTLPTYHRSNRKGIHFFINSRKVQAKEIMFALENAYENTLPKGRFPLAVLAIEFNPTLLDVNVHPGKLEIRIRDQFFAAEFSTLLKEKISEQQKIPQLNIIQRLAGNNQQRIEPKSQNIKTNRPLPSQEVIKEFFSWQPEIEAQQQTISSIKEESKKFIITSDCSAELATKVEAEEPLEPAAKLGQGLADSNNEFLPPLRVIGQLAQTFILAEGPAGLYIIDQHVAHERVLFERLLAQADQGGLHSQMLLAPQTVELTLLEEELLIQHILPLTDLGMIIEHFGPRTYLLRAVPSVVKEDPADFLMSLLQELEAQGDKYGPSEIKREVLVTASCKGAVKAGAKLSPEAISQLLADLAQCQQPLTCPHGRPIVYQVTHNDLLKAFRRI